MNAIQFHNQFRPVLLLPNGNRLISATHYTTAGEALSHQFTKSDIKNQCSPKTWNNFYAGRAIIK